MPRFTIIFNNQTREFAFYKLKGFFPETFRTENATCEEMEDCLAQTEHDFCYLSLEKFFNGGSASITLDSEKGEYYMVYADTRDEDEDGDIIVKTYWNPNRSSTKTIEFAGEYLQDSVICDDFNIVKEIFRQFIDEDRISEDLMD